MLIVDSHVEASLAIAACQARENKPDTTTTAAIIALIIVLYGGLLWGLMPGLEGISWESHLAGTAVGLLLAIAYRHYDIPPAEIDPFLDEEEETGIDYKYRG